MMRRCFDPSVSRLLSRIPGRWGYRRPGRSGRVLSKASDYCHGSVVVVDGGWLNR